MERYLAVEEKFSPLIKEKLTNDQIYAELIAQNKESNSFSCECTALLAFRSKHSSQENLAAVASLALAHGQLSTRSVPCPSRVFGCA